jgi:hypothetical protein
MIQDLESTNGISILQENKYPKKLKLTSKKEYEIENNTKINLGKVLLKFEILESSQKLFENIEFVNNVERNNSETKLNSTSEDTTPKEVTPLINQEHFKDEKSNISSENNQLNGKKRKRENSLNLQRKIRDYTKKEKELYTLKNQLKKETEEFFFKKKYLKKVAYFIQDLEDLYNLIFVCKDSYECISNNENFWVKYSINRFSKY